MSAGPLRRGLGRCRPSWGVGRTRAGRQLGPPGPGVAAAVSPGLPGPGVAAELRGGPARVLRHRDLGGVGQPRAL